MNRFCNCIVRLRVGEALWASPGTRALINEDRSGAISAVNIDGYRLCALEREPRIVTLAWRLAEWLERR